MPGVESSTAPFRMHVIAIDREALPTIGIVPCITQGVVAEDSHIPLIAKCFLPADTVIIRPRIPCGLQLENRSVRGIRIDVCARKRSIDIPATILVHAAGAIPGKGEAQSLWKALFQRHRRI